MNNLQPLDTSTNDFVSVKPDHKPTQNKIINEHDFARSVFDKKAIDTQTKIPSIQGNNKTYFYRAYLRFGFHEDGMLSAVNVAAMLGINTPWYKTLF